MTVESVLRSYARSHGSQVSAPATMAYAISPMIVFFSGEAHKADPAGGWPRKQTTVSDLTYTICKQYWDWRREFTVRMRDGRATVAEGGVSDGTIIREMAGTLRPALQHAIGNRLSFVPRHHSSRCRRSRADAITGSPATKHHCFCGRLDAIRGRGCTFRFSF